MYAVTRPDGHIECEFPHLLDAMAALPESRPGYQVRRCIDGAILAIRPALVGSNSSAVRRAEYHNAKIAASKVDDWGDRGPRG